MMSFTNLQKEKSRSFNCRMWGGGGREMVSLFLSK
jgi:hypothetical protein